MRLIFLGSVGLIAYVFIGYPAAIAAFARIRPRPAVGDASHEPSVSLIIAAYNEEDVIGAKLENVRRLDYPSQRLEVMVVADGSDDRTAEIARSFPDVTVLDSAERGGKLAAINRAVKHAKGEVLVLSDANNHYTPETLRELVAPFVDETVGVVTGRKAIDDGHGRPLDRAEGLYWRYESKIKEWESTVASVTGVAGEILAFRRAAYSSPRAGTMNEDFVQALQAALDGWRVVYAPRAVSVERASASIGDEAIRRSRLVTGRWQALRELLPRVVRQNPLLAWQVVSHKGLRPLVPLAMCSAAVSNVALVRARPWARVFAVLQLAFYASAVAGRELERRGRRTKVLYLPYYFCRMNVATLDGIRNFAARRHEAVWAKVRRA